MSQQLQTSHFPEIVISMAAKSKVDPALFDQTIRATIFPSGKAPTNEQVIAFLFVAEQYELDPWRKEIHAFPGKGGSINPVMGIDGWLALANRNPHFDGLEVIYGKEDDDMYCEVTVHRSDRKHSPPIREWLSECKRGTDPWRTMPKRMLRNRAIAQAVRISFGISGIMLTDEREAMQGPRNVHAEEVAQATEALIQLDVSRPVEEPLTEEEMQRLDDAELAAERSPEPPAPAALFDDGNYSNG